MNEGLVKIYSIWSVDDDGCINLPVFHCNINSNGLANPFHNLWQFFFFWGGNGGFFNYCDWGKKKLPGRGIQETVIINSDSMNIDSLT